MRHVAETLSTRSKTTRITKLIIKRRLDHSIRKIEITERRDTTWYPPTYTYDELFPAVKISK
jgi:hypothetical protein